MCFKIVEISSKDFFKLLEKTKADGYSVTEPNEVVYGLFSSAIFAGFGRDIPQPPAFYRMEKNEEKIEIMPHFDECETVTVFGGDEGVFTSFMEKYLGGFDG